MWNWSPIIRKRLVFCACWCVGIEMQRWHAPHPAKNDNRVFMGWNCNETFCEKAGLQIENGEKCQSDRKGVVKIKEMAALAGVSAATAINCICKVSVCVVFCVVWCYTDAGQIIHPRGRCGGKALQKGFACRGSSSSDYHKIKSK